MIQKVDKSNREIITELFRAQSSPKVLTYLQGYAGEAYVDNLEDPTVAVIMVSIFAIIAGDPQSNFAENLLQSIPDKRLIIAPSDAWNKKIEEVLTTSVTKHRQYRCSSKANSFDIPTLESYKDTLQEGYTLKQIDMSIISDTDHDGLPQDFTENFGSVNEFVERGVGFWILHNGAVVSGATSFYIYDGGIEIDIETDEDHRGKGLATVVAAELIFYCLEHNLTPHWEATNPTSLKLALKLGYSFESECDSYWIWRG